MVSVGTQTPSSWLRSLSEYEKKSKSSVDDTTLSSCSALPVISAPFSEAREDQNERLSLPQIVGEEEAGSDPEPQIVRHLSALQFPNDSDNSSSSSGEEEEASLPPLVPSAGQSREPELSWPAVLRYLRESESEASKYFSIDRQARSEVERDTGRENTNTGYESSVSSEQKSLVQEMGQQCCHFCGQPLEQWSVLRSATETVGQNDNQEGEREACCWQYKEYCLLVAGCLRQMVSERESAAPTAISVKLRNKKDVKTEAEQRALSLLQRRRRQRRKLAKKTLQSSSFYSLTKQTKTIQFSLVSPAVLSTGWTLGERQRAEKKKKRKKKAAKMLPPDIQELLIKSVPDPREVEVGRYSDNSSVFCALHPDHTGQYRYPSGSLAVLIHSHTPGALGYLLFNEGGEDVLGYADELGRVWCTHPPPDTNLRLWMTSCGEGGMYTVAGDVLRQWGRENEGLFQPLVLPLNKHLTLQLPRKSEVIINFSPTQQHHVKFTVTNKLREKSGVLVRERAPVDTTEDYYQCYLIQTQARLKYMLPVQGSRRRRGARGRSRSTGALNLSSTFSHSSRVL